MRTCLLLNFITLMAVLICWQETKTTVIAVNIALNKVAKGCGKVLTKITDGDKDPYSYDILDGDCRSVSINLVHAYDIHYVVVYIGKGVKKLDYFVIYVGVNTCSRFWGPMLTIENGIRLNCAVIDMQSVVKLQSPTISGFSISEIEVHNLATEIPGKRPKYFRGCFKKFGGKDEKSMSPMIPEDCQSHCINSKLLYFGIKENSRCLCANDYDENDELPIEFCDIFCNDGVTRCGGKKLTSVYLGSVRIPVYQNCEKVMLDKHDAVMMRPSSSLTVAECLHTCNDFYYASLESGYNCYCLSAPLHVIEIRPTYCNRTCSGNSNEYCGGTTFFSIYNTCLRHKVASAKCSTLMKCAGLYDKNGVCIGGCKEGFRGEHCYERANVSVGNELEVNHLKYLMILFSLAPILSVVFLVIIICFYTSPNKTESLDEIPSDEINPLDAVGQPNIDQTAVNPMISINQKVGNVRTVSSVPAHAPQVTPQLVPLTQSQRKKKSKFQASSPPKGPTGQKKVPQKGTTKKK